MKGILLIILSCISTAAFAENHIYATADSSEITIPDYTPPGAAEPAVNEKLKAATKITYNVATAWHDFFDKLHTCTSGNYILEQINPVIAEQYGNLETTKIMGWRDDKCHLSIMYYSENDPRLTPNPQSTAPVEKYPAGQECYFSKETIESVIEFDNRILRGQTITASNDDPYSRAMAEECSPFVIMEGKKVF